MTRRETDSQELLSILSSPLLSPPLPLPIVICSLISWAVWAGWQTEFNNGDGNDNPSSSTDISELKLGVGPVFMIIVMLMLGVNVYLQKEAYNDEEAEEIKVSGEGRVQRKPLNAHHF